MTVVHRPDELAGRLAAEAARRGITVDELAAETLSASLLASTGAQVDPLEAFIGSGDSGDPTWAAQPSIELRQQAARRAG
jgi:hypothetical protein